jgi:hypothetical protein
MNFGDIRDFGVVTGAASHHECSRSAATIAVLGRTPDTEPSFVERCRSAFPTIAPWGKT